MLGPARDDHVLAGAHGGASSARSHRIGQNGAALLTVLVMVVVAGLAAAKGGQALGALLQREREAELLWRGQQYQQAIARYCGVRQGAPQMFPSQLEDLVRDPRFPGIVRHLRRLYPDPMTGAEWELVKDPAGRIVGVRSTSTLKPFQKAGFPKGLEDLEGKSSYREWEFVFTAARQTETPVQGAGSKAQGTGGLLPTPRNQPPPPPTR